MDVMLSNICGAQGDVKMTVDVTDDILWKNTESREMHIFIYARENNAFMMDAW